MLLNEEQMEGYRKAAAPFLDGLHEAARLGQTRKRQWPSAWLAQPRAAQSDSPINMGKQALNHIFLYVFLFYRESRPHLFHLPMRH